MRDFIERFVPRNSLPTRIHVALGAGAFDGIIETIGAIDKLRRGFALDAHDTAIGMIIIRVEAGDFAVFDRRDCRAVRRAERAVAAHFFNSISAFSWF